MEWDGPTLSPKRSQARASAWYLFTPFEYPDDLRLRDGSCYRLIWIDTVGLLIRLKPEESIPSLYFFLSPPIVPNTTMEDGPPVEWSEVSQQLVAALHQLLCAYQPLSNELNPTLMDLANSDKARVAEPPYYVPSAASEHSTESGGEVFRCTFVSRNLF